jgi:hypothetical protein
MATALFGPPAAGAITHPPVADLAADGGRHKPSQLRRASPPPIPPESGYVAAARSLGRAGALEHSPPTLASAHRDSALKAAHAMLTWPLPMTQPILAGVAGFVLLGIAVQTNGWRQVSARQSTLLAGFVIAAVLGAGPMVLFCILTVVIFSLVISFVLLILFILILRLILAR